MEGGWKPASKACRKSLGPRGLLEVQETQASAWLHWGEGLGRPPSSPCPLFVRAVP